MTNKIEKGEEMACFTVLDVLFVSRSVIICNTGSDQDLDPGIKFFRNNFAYMLPT